MIRLQRTRDPESICLTFIDEGKPFDPLTRPDPDVTLAPADRPIGGIGIHMVKKSMDEVRYVYLDNRNISCL